MTKKTKALLLSCFVSLLTCFTLIPCFAEEKAEEISSAVSSLPDMVLWEEAMDLLNEGKGSEAGNVLLKLRELYPESAMAEDALWRAAQLLKAEALAAEEPDWNAVRAAFRRYSSEYPKSSHAEEAYLEVGITHARMRYFREALVYLNLFFKRYPDSNIIGQATFWKAKTLLEIGRLAESRQLLEKFPKDAPLGLRMRVARLLGTLFFENGDFKKVFTLYDQLKKELKPYSQEELNFIKLRGLSHLRLQQEEKGRVLLYRYLNIIESGTDKNEILFELAESYTRGKDRKIAQRIYERIIEDGKKGDREVVLSTFRLTEFQNDPSIKRSAWQKPADPTDPAGDVIYNTVLENYYREPIAQDVRHGLFIRYLARDDFEEALRLGKSYLQNTTGAGQPGRDDKAGKILMTLEEELFKRGEYQKVYDLYKQYYKYVEKLGSGHLLSLVGLSLENLGLLEQAAVVYYRALGMSLEEDEKTEIYFRRARLYLRIKDYKSARRLLAFLQRSYKGMPEFGEVCFLSGRLQQATGVPEEALAFYKRAISLPVSPGKKPLYAGTQLQLFFELERISEFTEALQLFEKDKWLSVAQLQDWYNQLGHYYWKQGKLAEAKNVYLAGLKESMPAEGANSQTIHFFLGDIYLKQGDEEVGKKHLTIAQEGPVDLWKELAGRRIQEQNIDQAAMELQPIAKRPETTK